MRKEVKLYLNSAGYCLAKESHTIKGGSATAIKFNSLFGLLYHEESGWILFDTGYAKRFFEATGNFPYKLYSVSTKVTVETNEEVKEQIRHFGLDSSDIKHIIISHFHADHIGGLKDFENARFYCSRKAYDQVININRYAGLTKGILKSLIPDDFQNRVKIIEDIGTLLHDDIFNFKYDLFNDKTILIYDLPGHAEGQIGIEINTKKQKYFLIADACWHESAYKNSALPDQIVRIFFKSWKGYKETLKKIYQYHKNNPEVKIVPSHCNKVTESLINNFFDINVL
jgi:glyoxylase-like metal-dependent hydrolase (beta-lactamase superfamily II)